MKRKAYVRLYRNKIKLLFKSCFRKQIHKTFKKQLIFAFNLSDIISTSEATLDFLIVRHFDG